MAFQKTSPELVRARTTVISYVGEHFDGVLSEQVRDALRRGAAEVVVDLGNVRMVSSSVFTTLHRAGARLHARGGRLTVVSGHPALARLLRLILLSRAFAVVSSREDALRRGP